MPDPSKRILKHYVYTLEVREDILADTELAAFELLRAAYPDFADDFTLGDVYDARPR